MPTIRHMLRQGDRRGAFEALERLLTIGLDGAGAAGKGADSGANDPASDDPPRAHARISPRLIEEVLRRLERSGVFERDPSDETLLREARAELLRCGEEAASATRSTTDSTADFGHAADFASAANLGTGEAEGGRSASPSSPKSSAPTPSRPGAPSAGPPPSVRAPGGRGPASGSDADSNSDSVDPLEGLQEASGSWFRGGEPSRPPERIGRYLVIRELDSGGFGRVFHAVSDDDLKLPVAIKVMHHAGTEETKRFASERTILANLRHPNIARFESSGVLEDGRPWIAMEFIEGLTLLKYCEREGLSTEARLKLFRKICEAVHEAHKWSIVHLDIKPTNIMVTLEGEPKLLDFGIAKIRRSFDASGRTTTARAGISYLYSSPEQLRGEPVCSASDVYNLGLVLYELLTGSRARLTAATEVEAFVREVMQREPELPSERVRKTGDARKTAELPGIDLSSTTSATRSQGGVGPLASKLRGNIDNIVMMAMRREPSGRYSSAMELADDIGRHLDLLPVIARRNSRGYRFAMHLQRHRRSMLVALLAVTTLAAILFAAWANDRARHQAEIAEREAQISAQREEINRHLQSVVDAERVAFLARREDERSLDRELGWIRNDLIRFPQLLELLDSRSKDEQRFFDAMLARMQVEPNLRLSAADVFSLSEAELKYAFLRNGLDKDGSLKQAALGSLIALEERLGKVPDGVLGEVDMLSIKARLLEIRGDIRGVQSPEGEKLFEEALLIRSRIVEMRKGDLDSRYDYAKCLARVCEAALRRKGKDDQDAAVANRLAEELLALRIEIHERAIATGVSAQEINRKERDLLSARHYLFRAAIQANDIGRASDAAKARLELAEARHGRASAERDAPMHELDYDLALALDDRVTCMLMAGGPFEPLPFTAALPLAERASLHARRAAPAVITTPGPLAVMLELVRKHATMLLASAQQGATDSAIALIDRTIEDLDAASRAQPRSALDEGRPKDLIVQLRLLRIEALSWSGRVRDAADQLAESGMGRLSRAQLATQAPSRPVWIVCLMQARLELADGERSRDGAGVKSRRAEVLSWLNAAIDGATARGDRFEQQACVRAIAAVVDRAAIAPSELPQLADFEYRAGLSVAQAMEGAGQ